MEEQKKKKPKTKLEEWASQGIPCYYARFHQPVPPFKDAEPVSEFYISSKQTKYCVDSINYSEHGLIWKVKGEHDLMPLANVILARSIQSEQ